MHEQRQKIHSNDEIASVICNYFTKEPSFIFAMKSPFSAMWPENEFSHVTFFPIFSPLAASGSRIDDKMWKSYICRTSKWHACANTKKAIFGRRNTFVHEKLHQKSTIHISFFSFHWKHVPWLIVNNTKLMILNWTFINTHFDQWKFLLSLVFRSHKKCFVFFFF